MVPRCDMFCASRKWLSVNRPSTVVVIFQNQKPASTGIPMDVDLANALSVLTGRLPSSSSAAIQFPGSLPIRPNIPNNIPSLTVPTAVPCTIRPLLVPNFFSPPRFSHPNRVFSLTQQPPGGYAHFIRPVQIQQFQP